MPKLNITAWLALFYCYCFLGWCFETAYVSIYNRRPENRGFLYGPFLPLYGSGAILLTLLTAPFADSLLLTYLSGCLWATILELATGLAMEWLLGFRYWDYSAHKFQYKGYICLRSSLFWGVLTIFMTRLLQPWLLGFVYRVPEMLLQVSVLVLTLALLTDFAFSLKAALQLRGRLLQLDAAGRALREVQLKMQQAMEQAGEQLSEVSGQAWQEFLQKYQGKSAPSALRALQRLRQQAELGKNERIERLQQELYGLAEAFRKNRRMHHNALHKSLPYGVRRLLRYPTLKATRMAESLERLRRRNARK